VAQGRSDFAALLRGDQSENPQLVGADAAAAAAVKPEIAAAMALDRGEQLLESGERLESTGAREQEAPAQCGPVRNALQPLAQRPDDQLLAERELRDGRFGHDRLRRQWDR
jgi:hypothetical protein